MTVHRIRVPAVPDSPAVVAVSDEDVHHLRVRRAEPGQAAVVFDGAGRTGTGSLARTGDGWEVAIRSVETAPPPPPVVLLVGAGDKDRFAWLVEKAVEAGATRLIPVDTARSVAVAGRIRASHLERLQRRADEALKQSGGVWALRIEAPMALAEALALPLPDVRWLGDAAGPSPIFVAGGNPGVAALIGPEGGLTDPEREAAEEAGFMPVRLGARTLRFETAAVAAALLARLEWKEHP